MYKPTLTIDLPKLRDNARVEKEELLKNGVEILFRHLAQRIQLNSQISRHFLFS